MCQITNNKHNKNNTHNEKIYPPSPQRGPRNRNPLPRQEELTPAPAMTTSIESRQQLLNTHLLSQGVGRWVEQDNRHIKGCMLSPRGRIMAQKYQQQKDIIKSIETMNILSTPSINAPKRNFQARVLDSIGTVFTYLDLTTNTRGTMTYRTLDYVNLPDDLFDECQRLKVGATLELVEMTNGRVYPNHKTYGKTMPTPHPLLNTVVADKRPKTTKAVKMDRCTLFADTIRYEQTPSLDSLWNRFAAKCGELTPAEIMSAITMKGTASTDEQTAFLCTLLGIAATSLSPQESHAVEYKSSFVHSAKAPQSERTIQYNEILSELLAFANSHVEGQLFIGVNNGGEIVGVEDELLNDTPFANRADFEADFRNFINQSTGNFAFCNSLSIDWFHTDNDHLFCRITVPQWNNNVILMRGTELYVREGASRRQLKNNDFIQYILSNCKTAA